MKLPTKTLLLLLVITAMSFSSAIYIQRTFVYPELVELEAKADRKDVQRVAIGFDMVRNVINTLAYDYGVWDDTFEFLANPSEQYIASNLGIDNFLRHDFDVAILADRDGNIVWYGYVDLAAERFFPPDAYNPEELRPYFADPYRTRPGAPLSNSGIVNTTKGPLIFSSYSVLKSDETGESRGSLLFGRHVDQSIAEEVQDIVKMDFSFATLTPGENQQLKGKNLSWQYRDNNNRMDWYLRDIFDDPILTLSVQLDERAFNDSLIGKPILTALAVMMVSWMIIIITLNRVLVKPILKIGKHLFHIRSTGDYSARLNYRGNDEVGDLGNECDLLIQFIEVQQDELEKQSEKLHRLSIEDGLTGLANRRRFDQTLNSYWEISEREKYPLVLLMCDIDFFKQYNDHYGHQQGDEAIQAVAEVLRSATNRKTDLAARYGGEEFAVLLPNTEIEGAEIIAQRIHSLIKEKAIPHQLSTVSEELTMCVGIGISRNHSEIGKDELIEQADKALYLAKAAGRNQTAIYHDTDLIKKRANEVTS
ncbi:diguanylate cyclase domain-containing protein [Oceanicoccus sagamiensis]|uniref:diguanylate cyclase n=1 Tax=Oceanicoccus sagamiensis TaxID=716816 RepID=A0A1X9NIA5_9GAMM|nr:diguanylate cyclase [Oceanicoccus sagamiensis]ARN74627.1 hypothetical protein BST96_11135 [Oceanicoccus sagamiensis]